MCVCVCVYGCNMKERENCYKNEKSKNVIFCIYGIGNFEISVHIP